MRAGERWGLALLAVAWLAACSDVSRSRRGDDDDDDDGGGGEGTGASGGGVTSSTVGSGGADGGAGPEGGAGTGAGPVDTVCNRWNADRAALSEGTWSGSVDSCTAGDVSADGRDNALKLVNLYRFLTNLPEVAHDPGSNGDAQACALMMDANNQLSHSPPTSWNCYNAQGANGAGSSNIATTPGVAAVDLYIADPGNDNTIGHRRWILSNSLGPIGLGSTSTYSCMRVIGGSGNAGADYVGWPPAGIVPFEAFHASFASVDDTGWTIQSDSINLNGATVTISDGGESLPIQQSTLLGGYGSAQAVKMIPVGWESQAGHTYHVSVSGASAPIDYDVSVVQCQ